MSGFCDTLEHTEESLVYLTRVSRTVRTPTVIGVREDRFTINLGGTAEVLFVPYGRKGLFLLL